VTRPDSWETIVPAVAHKHYPPRIADDVVPRPRVIDELVGRISRHALVQVVAAAGAGKTTAVVQAARALDRSVAWLSLDEWHRSPSRMLDDLVAALEHIAPGLAGEVARNQIQGAGAAELAATTGYFMHRQHALLVVDDCHVVRDAVDAVAVLAAVIRRGPPGLHTVVVGRSALPFRGLSVEMHDPDASIRDDLLRASSEEAEQVLRAHGSSVSVRKAMEATEGWIAGLVFETWHARGSAAPSTDPLGDYLKREVRPRLTPDADELLVAASLFDTVTMSRAEALGESDVGSWYESLRQSGLPAVWASDGSEMRLHPRIREVLRDDLRSSSPERRRSALGAAARAYESEGSFERALELFLELGDVSGAQRLAPEVVLGAIERGDVASADRYLAAAGLAEDPRIVLARLALASIRADRAEGVAALEPLLESGRLSGTLAEVPPIGTLACMFLVVSGDLERAFEVLDDIPRGRAFDVARLFLSLVRDDPDAPIPSFNGDVLDSVLARAVYQRGLFEKLRGDRTLWSESTGVYEFDRAAPGPERPSCVLSRGSRPGRRTAAGRRRASPRPSHSGGGRRCRTRACRRCRRSSRRRGVAASALRPS
jgi:ATP/maltotriose-dependent transcriptional regulator MalT